jgi:hypothetical protein
MPPSERLDVSTVYSMEPLSSSLRTLTGMFRLKRGVVLSLVYVNPPARQRLNAEGGFSGCSERWRRTVPKSTLCRNTRMSQFDSRGNLGLGHTVTFANRYCLCGVYDAAGFTMARERTQIGKILVTAVVCLLLCGIVAGEFPELLSLTDNATNDFTVVRTKSSAFPVLVRASSRGPAVALDHRIPATTLLLSYPSSFQAAASIPLKRSALYSVLRT